MASVTSSSNGIFSIHGMGLKLTTADDAEPYTAILSDMGDAVTEVHFGGNTLGVEACRAIAAVVKTKTHLKVADFADIFTGRLISEIPQALEALCDALIDLEELVEVDLSDNAFGGRVAEPMVPFLSQNKHFQILRLTNNGMGPAGGTVIANALLANAKACKEAGRQTSIQAVICGRNRLENGSAPFFAEAYKALGASLKEVRMVQNGIRMEGIATLAKALRSCPNLETLDLQDNTATDVGSRAIASSLKSWPQLKHLNLSDCLLRPRGAISLMNALLEGSNTSLESLRIQSDEVDARAVDILANAVKLHLKNLSAVELDGNRVEADDESVQRLVSALAENGHDDALDEIEDVEEVDEEEEEEEDDAVESEAEELEDKLEETVVTGKIETGGEDVRANEAEVVQADKLAEAKEPKAQADAKEDDDLANLMAKTGLGA